MPATADGDAPLDGGRWERQVEALAADGQRVLALAAGAAGGSRELPAAELGQPTLLGLVGLIDPPRPEAQAAVAECRAAGIAVKMITGDHAATARAIAARLGLAERRERVTGRELDRLDDAGFAAAVPRGDGLRPHQPRAQAAAGRGAAGRRAWSWR